MRLLERKDIDEFSLTKDLIGNIPAYAILSHTWGDDDQEVAFKDFTEGSGKSKARYQKIRFCGEQAARDGYRYIWVDTCCIDKSNNAELSEALNCTYRWYQNAAKCYVYLVDVSTNDQNPTKGPSQSSDEAFQKSRWFTRGWTLQELIAPQSVEFFSFEGKLLGDKKSLEGRIHEITGITVSALQGMPLSEFSVMERFLWAAKRETKKEEDKAYSLLGIFGVFLPLIYGEGQENAFRRLREEVDRSVKSPEFDNFPKSSVENQPKFTVPFVRDPKFVGREDIMTNLLEIQRRVIGLGNSGTCGVRSGIRCFRCDNRHVLDECFASLETVSKARDRRMNSNRCVNCGSGKHWVKECDWEDLL
jgi:hypothetical protein